MIMRNPYSFPGAGAPGGFGGGGTSGWRPPGWVGPVTSLIGGIFQGIGRNRQRGETRNEDSRLEDEARRRARGKAALLRGVMDANGYGHMMTDEQILDLLMRTDRRNNTEGGVFGDIGSVLSTGGSQITTAYRPPGASQRSSDFWRWIEEQLQSGGRPTLPQGPA